MNSSKIQSQLQQLSKQLLRFRVPIFLAVVALIYVFIVWRVDTLKNAPPAAEDVASQLKSSTHIDQTTVNKIKQLQDNSTNVRTLFNQARHNPFQE